MVKIKRRYILCEILYEQSLMNYEKKSLDYKKISEHKLHETVMTNLKSLFGIYGRFNIKPLFKIIYYNQLTNFAIFSCPRDNQSMLEITLSCIKAAQGHNIKLLSISISGTVKSLEDRIISETWKRLLLLKSKADQVDQRQLASIIDQCRPHLVKKANKDFKCDYDYFSKMFKSIGMSFY
ncbi:MAG: RNA-binding protein pop5 [Marteilia pararefringens]